MLLRVTAGQPLAPKVISFMGWMTMRGQRLTIHQLVISAIKGPIFGSQYSAVMSLFHSIVYSNEKNWYSLSVWATDIDAVMLYLELIIHVIWIYKCIINVTVQQKQFKQTKLRNFKPRVMSLFCSLVKHLHKYKSWYTAYSKWKSAVGNIEQSSTFRRMPQKCVFKNLCCCHSKRRIGGWGLVNPSSGMRPSIKNLWRVQSTNL